VTLAVTAGQHKYPRANLRVGEQRMEKAAIMISNVDGGWRGWRWLRRGLLSLPLLLRFRFRLLHPFIPGLRLGFTQNGQSQDAIELRVNPQTKLLRTRQPTIFVALLLAHHRNELHKKSSYIGIVKSAHRHAHLPSQHC
jgi:hypothetical protein